jgi:hypothetical protein
LLARQITSDVLTNRDHSPAKNILFKYFSENKELGKEWQLYHFLLNEKAKSEIQAEKYLDIVIAKRLKLNNKKLSDEKYNLIKEIKETYQIEDFLKSNIKNYKVNASICKIFEDSASSQEKFDMTEIVQSRNCVCENLCGIKKETPAKEDERIMDIYKQQNESVRMLSYKILVDSLNEKYKDLNVEQKHVLREYINNISNNANLSAIVLTEFGKIKTALMELKSKIADDVVMIKINETIKQFDLIKPKIVKDNHVMAILLGYELIKEIQEKII